MLTIKSVCEMLLILAPQCLDACKSRGNALLTIKSGKTFNEQTHRYVAPKAIVQTGWMEISEQGYTLVLIIC